MSRYTYQCAQCGGSVQKKETGTNISKTAKAGLHGWSCPKDGRGVKVVRKLNKE